jgi:hypothetical protein
VRLVLGFSLYGTAKNIYGGSISSARPRQLSDVISIQLTARRSAARARLDFVELPIEGKQKRLQGRTVLKPDIDLDRYSCRAVIDACFSKSRTPFPVSPGHRFH